MNKTIKKLSFIKKVDRNKNGKSFSPDCSGNHFCQSFEL